jgi:hypothetical protein
MKAHGIAPMENDHAKKEQFRRLQLCDKPQSNGGIRRPMLNGQHTTAGRMQKVTSGGWMCG